MTQEVIQLVLAREHFWFSTHNEEIQDIGEHSTTLQPRSSRIPDSLQIADYEDYLEYREEVIKSVQGRAALLRGGLLWRLAHDAYADNSAVYNGPSGFQSRSNHRGLDGLDYVNNELLPHQEDVICRVYRVMLEHPENGPSGTAYQMWWPTVTTWSQSGVDLDYWSARNEQFFVNNCKAILDGKVLPKTAQEWRRTLAHRKAAKMNMLTNIGELSGRALPAAM
ncbi:hypothetical protein BC835DRAFT_1303425 [Cytidiella melzeri]|nr:hypothetical protein BC835DRAFT_1303425 [Cytidiella melzeri]